MPLLCAGAGLASAQPAAAGASSSCYVPGFTLKQRQQPAGTAYASGLVLYTTPHTPDADAPAPRPHSTLAATAAACEADNACVMLTSDGYTIAANSWAAKPSQPPPTEADIAWQSMAHCANACCGTWVADTFTAQLRGGGAASQQTRTVSGRTLVLPSDPDPKEFLARSLLQTVCAGKPAGSTDPGSGVGSPDCPQRCVVACCKQLQDRQPFSDDTDPKLWMGRYLFSQCSASTCQACRFAGPVKLQFKSLASPTGDVLLRQYLRAKVVEEAGGRPASAAGRARSG